MSARKVSTKQFPKIFKDFIYNLKHEAIEAGVRGIVNYMPKLVASSPVDTGQYASSWLMEREEEAVIIGNFAPHSPMIEFGARPFKPPLQPLLAWAKRVLKDASQPPKYSPKVQALARGTQRKIEKEGMKPKHVLKKAIPGIIEEMRYEFNKMRMDKIARVQGKRPPRKRKDKLDE